MQSKATLFCNMMFEFFQFLKALDKFYEKLYDKWFDQLPYYGVSVLGLEKTTVWGLKSTAIFPEFGFAHFLTFWRK